MEVNFWTPAKACDRALNVPSLSIHTNSGDIGDPQYRVPIDIDVLRETLEQDPMFTDANDVSVHPICPVLFAPVDFYWILFLCGLPKALENRTV
ncbi:hypothetical protein [Micropruina sp.]|uniref:hypothetical protein n=1 Tax=Micropruina sp. TaxID=2737536 RepID=UPI0039E5D215